MTDLVASPLSRVGRLIIGLMPLCAGVPAAVADQAIQWRNDHLSVAWAPGSPTLTLVNAKTGAILAIPVGLDAIDLDTGRLTGLGGVPAMPAITRPPGGQVWTFASPEVAVPNTPLRLRCTTAFELSVDRSWIRKNARIEFAGDGGPVLLREVVLDALDLKGRSPRQPFDGWQSYPVLCESFFCGVEFPAGQAVVSGDTARLSCRPGDRLTCRDRYDCWPAVYGVSDKGESRAAFEAYIESLRPRSGALHIQYNSWWSAPFPFTERHMLDIIDVFRDAFFRPYGGRLDSFCLDLGWADAQAIWKLDVTNFPQGFAPLTRALDASGARLALWVSPSSCYPCPGALDSHWAWRSGYETFARGDMRHTCLAGRRYPQAFKESLVDLARRYRIAHYKFDGYIATCPESDHGHEPGELSADRMARGIVDVFQALRTVSPDIWLEPTCFGFRPSPWWLMYVNSVIGTFGDDAPIGRVPCPVFRDAYTTARDYFNLQGALDILAPAAAQEVLGIIHQTPEPLQNDAVTVVLRGHAFIPLYVNPKYMDVRRWRFLANLCTWARNNADLLGPTRALFFGGWADEKKARDWNVLPRDPYGYAHFRDNAGLILLRNPWIRPTRVDLTLDASVGATRALAGAPLASLYPRYGRMPGSVSYGDRLPVKLGPYETKLLAIGRTADAPPLAPELRLPALRGIEPQIAPARDRLHLAFEAPGGVAGRQLCILNESGKAFEPPDCRIRVNGSLVAAEARNSDGWRASGMPVVEYWVWQLADLPPGPARVEVDIEAQDAARVSAWLVLKESVADDPKTSGPIPPPEERYLDAAEVVPPVDLRWIAADAENVALASQGAKATASSVWADEYEPGKAIDGNAETRWNSAAGDVNGAWLAVDFGRPRRIQSVRFTEAGGGRITRYAVQQWKGDAWVDLVTAEKTANRTTVRCRFEPIETTRIRLLVVAATEVPTIYDLEAR